MAEPQGSFNVKCRPALRARADACARLAGLGMGDFVRAAIRTECERVERLHGQSVLAQRAAANLSADGVPDNG